MNNQKIKDRAKESILLQTSSINRLKNSINDDFVNAVETIFNSNGRLIISGIGKSAHIANKIVASLNSTGTPSLFLHAAEAIHGDLGMIQKEDVIILISKSGNTPEIKALIPLVKNFEIPIIAITGNTGSFLAKNANYVLDTYVEKEACINDLAPSTSTTAQLVMGDALMVCLEDMRNFTNEDFAKYHPGGSLGKQLYLKVEDIVNFDLQPTVHPEDSISKVLIAITENLKGIAAVIENNTIIGIITDGDIRRMLLQNTNFQQLKAKDIMGISPKTIQQDSLAKDALTIMERHDITQLLVTKDSSFSGVLHLHDILDAGIK